MSLCVEPGNNILHQATKINFLNDSINIHNIAAGILLSNNKNEVLLTNSSYHYLVNGGGGGCLYYKKSNWSSWVLIANWCFYGLYIIIRYRKPIWLRNLYIDLFTKMNFISISFLENSIELIAEDGAKIKSRRFNLMPPRAIDNIMKDKFNFSDQDIEDLKKKLNL
jgi:hypothetical protein